MSSYEKLRMTQDVQRYVWDRMSKKIHNKYKEKESALYKEFLEAFYKEVDVPEEVIQGIFEWKEDKERKWLNEKNITYIIRLTHMRKNYLPPEEERYSTNNAIHRYNPLLGRFDGYIYERNEKTKTHVCQNELEIVMSDYRPSELHPYTVLLLPFDNPKLKDWMGTRDKSWYGSIYNLTFTIDMRNKNDLPPAQKLMFDFFWKEKDLLDEYKELLVGAEAIIYSKSAKDIIELIPESKEHFDQYMKLFMQTSSKPSARFKREERIDAIKDYVNTVTKEVQ